jgi:hypothetical protein
MSHFSVYVIGENVARQLQPYHEFESTGINDEFVQNVDILQKAREDYEGGTTRRLKSPEGHLYEPWDDRFYREPTEGEAKWACSGSPAMKPAGMIGTAR